MYECMCVCKYVYMYVCMYASMYVCSQRGYFSYCLADGVTYQAAFVTRKAIPQYTLVLRTVRHAVTR